MKPNEAIPNINEHNKTNSVFSRVCLVPRASSMLLDDSKEFMYILSIESMIRGYHEYISKLLLESVLNTAILISLPQSLCKTN